VSEFVNPIENEELYDAIILAGTKSPGSVRLSGHKRSIGWDVKKGAGQSGATTTRTSEDPIEFTATFYLLKDDVLGVNDFEDWPPFASVIWSTISGKTPKAVDVYHPDLAALNVGAVVLKEFGGMVHDGKGGATIAITFLEYKPPKPKGGTPKGAKTQREDKDPNAAALAELARLTDQYRNTPWG
jgi:hypothetical protein